MVLVIGNKRFSSWSLRPWLLMKQFGIEFEEKLVLLDQPNTKPEILKYSQSGKVPALIDGEINIWDSMAIAEYLNEKYPEKNMWPKNSKYRAIARSISNEMHSGFLTMRSILSHDLQKELKDFDYSKAKDDIQRIKDIWSQCLRISEGPFLFGEFSIADAMYAPVVNRFISYGVSTDAACAGYVKTIRELPSHIAWINAGKLEPHQAPFHL